MHGINLTQREKKTHIRLYDTAAKRAVTTTTINTVVCLCSCLERYPIKQKHLWIFPLDVVIVLVVVSNGYKTKYGSELKCMQNMKLPVNVNDL